MRVQFIAKVIGHELTEPDKPKVEDDSMKVKLAVRAAQAVPGKSTAATLTMPADQAQEEFPLRRVLLITIEEGQKELLDAVAGDGEERLRGPCDPNQGDLMPGAQSDAAARRPRGRRRKQPALAAVPRGSETSQ